MNNTVEIKIKVFKECSTCKHINFLPNWESAVCSIDNQIVIAKVFEDERKEKEPCDIWDFDYKLFEDSDCTFLDEEYIEDKCK